MSLPSTIEKIKEEWSSYIIHQYTPETAPLFTELLKKHRELITDSLFSALYEFDRFRSIGVDNDKQTVADYAAYGVWLDYIGKIVGLPRPSSDSLADVKRFGFSSSAVGFNQGPFATALTQVGELSGINDYYYTLLLMGRIEYIFSDGLLNTYERMYAIIYGYAEIGEAGPHKSTLSIFDKGLPGLWNTARDNSLIYKPLCHSYEIPMNSGALTPGTNELFRWYMDVPSNANTGSGFTGYWFEDRTNVEGTFEYKRYPGSKKVEVAKFFWSRDFTYLHSPYYSSLLRLESNEMDRAAAGEDTLYSIFFSGIQYEMYILFNDTTNTDRPGVLRTLLMPRMEYFSHNNQSSYDTSSRRYRITFDMYFTGADNRIRRDAGAADSLVFVIAESGVEKRTLVPVIT